jgi:hypothetical protein
MRALRARWTKAASTGTSILSHMLHRQPGFTQIDMYTLMAAAKSCQHLTRPSGALLKAIGRVK